MIEMPEWLCLWTQGCSVAQYVSAMKVAVGVNLLAGVWIWFHRQSDEVRNEIDSKVGSLVGVVEDGGADLRSGIKDIAVNAERAIRRTAMRGIVGAALFTLLILLVAFFVKLDHPVTDFLWWLLALAGPLVMAGTYVRIKYRTRKAVNEATALANSKAGELLPQKPETVPDISGSPATGSS